MIGEGAVSRRVPRLDVLAYPSATSPRLFMLVITILSGGAYVGLSVHDWVLARSWLNAQYSCTNKAKAIGASLRSRYLQSCVSPADIRRGSFGVGAALVLTVLLIAIMLFAQFVISRRRPGRKMTRYYPSSTEYIDELMRMSDVSLGTEFLVGPSGQRDAFTYGALGRYRVQLPRGMAAKWRTRSLFEPIVLHELAHIFHRDVAWGWFARAAWYAVTPVMLASILVPALQHDWTYFWSYTWRALLLAVIAQLFIRSYLRSRETDADLRAAQLLQGTSEITTVISDAVPVRARRLSALAFHPGPAKRISAILDPASTVGVSFFDAFAAGLLAMLTAGVVQDVAQNLLEGLSNGVSAAEVVTNGLSNAILGFAVGGGLLRNVVVERSTGRRALVIWPALGIGLGISLGSLASLGQTGVGTFAGAAHPWQIATAACGGVVALVYSNAVARLWASAMPWQSRPRLSWVSYCLLATGVFWIAGWIASRLGDVLISEPDIGVWRTLVTSYDLALVGVPSRTLIVILLIVSALIALIFLRRPVESSPTWFTENAEIVTLNSFGPHVPAKAGIAVVTTGVAGAFGMLTLQWSGTSGPALIYPLIEIALATGVCGALVASAVSRPVQGALALPAAVGSCCLAFAVAIPIDTLFRLPFQISELSSIALPGITASAVGGVSFVPVIMRIIDFFAAKEVDRQGSRDVDSGVTPFVTAFRKSRKMIGEHRLVTAATAVVVIAAGITGGLILSPVLASSSLSRLAGSWTGTYTCPQGVTGVRLVIQTGSSGQLYATFSFYPVASNPKMPAGSFTMSGLLTASGAVLAPGHWISQPPGYQMITLLGIPPGIGQTTFRGIIPSCSSFALKKVP
jgi:Zn-dependent protease with chaperone function